MEIGLQMAVGQLEEFHRVGVFENISAASG
jgi:hypothetical protein